MEKITKEKQGSGLKKEENLPLSNYNITKINLSEYQIEKIKNAWKNQKTTIIRL